MLPCNQWQWLFFFIQHPTSNTQHMQCRISGNEFYILVHLNSEGSQIHTSALTVLMVRVVIGNPKSNRKRIIVGIHITYTQSKQHLAILDTTTTSLPPASPHHPPLHEHQQRSNSHSSLPHHLPFIIHIWPPLLQLQHTVSPYHPLHHLLQQQLQ
jgi:hypothetical protein